MIVEMKWGAQIKSYRSTKGVKQGAFAEYLNIDQATISRWERGITTPDLFNQRRLHSLFLEMASSTVDRRLMACVRHDVTQSGLFKDMRYIAASQPMVTAKREGWCPYKGTSPETIGIRVDEYEHDERTDQLIEDLITGRKEVSPELVCINFRSSWYAHNALHHFLVQWAFHPTSDGGHVITHHHTPCEADAPDVYEEHMLTVG